MTSPNERCPCGSGKKFKHCCRLAAGSAVSFEGNLQNQSSGARNLPNAEVNSHGDAVGKAIRWLIDRHRKGWLVALELLHNRLLSTSDRAKLNRLDDDTLNGVQINLVEWLLAEGQIQAQGTLRRISEYLIGPSGPAWTPPQRDWLLQMGQRPLRLYDVTDVAPGVGMTLCDSLNSDANPIQVRERSGSHALTPGMHLGCRLMRVDEHFELSGAAYAFSTLSGPAVAAQLRTIASKFQSEPELAREQGLVLMAAWLQQYLAPPRIPTLIDQHSGEPIAPITDHYRVLDEQALAVVLSACADVEGDRQAGWSRLLDCGDGQTRALVNINPGKKKDQLEVFYLTQERADQGRAWFESTAGKSVKYLTRTMIDPQRLMDKHFDDPNRKALGKKSSPGVDAEAMGQAMAQLIRRSYANWADQAIPALNNQTPRQAIQTPAGLERVKGLLRSYEAGERSQAAALRRDEISYDFLWASIGLSR